MSRQLLRLPVDEAVRLALQKSQAAEALGMSIDSFERYVQDDLRVVRRGSLRLYLVADLEQWLENNARLTLEEDQR